MNQDLQDVIKGINKKFGDGAIMRLGDDPGKYDISTVSSGSIKLDKALGGGVPLGRTIELYGPQMSGKTTLAFHIVANIQKQDGLAAFVDAEHTIDPKLAKEYGVDTDNLFVSQPNSGEEAIDVTEALIRSGKFRVIVIDSVAALTPMAEVETDMGQQHMGLQGKLMSKALRKITSIGSKNNCTVIFINQLREKVGIMFGNPEVTSGGRALKFYASIRINIRVIEKLKDKDGLIYGHKVKCKVTKNKVAPPFKEAEFELIYGKGFDNQGEVVDIALDLGILAKKGSWYSYDDQNIAQGEINTKQAVAADKELYEEILAKVKEEVSI